MSIDLEWHKLNGSLASLLISALNRQLSTTPRPSFIGPVEVTLFDFGSIAPDIELVDLRDIHPDFLEDDDDSASSEHSFPTKFPDSSYPEDGDGFEWVSRRAARRGTGDEGPAYHHLPPHVRYGRAPTVDLYASTPAFHTGMSRELWSAGAMHMSVPSLGDFRPPLRPTVSSSYRSAMGNSRNSLDSLQNFEQRKPPLEALAASDAPLSSFPAEPSQAQANASIDVDALAAISNTTTHPNLQLHFHVGWHSNLRITLTTSLLINYPSPMFMALPIKLSIIGLVFSGEVAVAYEGARNRVHISVLDELDPYGPACGRISGTPPDSGMDEGRAEKALPVGQRLLPSILIESEIGQADKHVLKNVTRVERFIQDVVRKTVEEELVFPNFHTMIMGDEQ